MSSVSAEPPFVDKAAALARLRALAAECAAPDWDSHGARAVDPNAVLVAESFLRALPEGLPLPELAAEPDGAVSLDWLESEQRIFSVSAGASQRLAFAWLDGTDRGHGVARFDGVNIPARIRVEIQTITARTDAPLRAA